MENKPFLNYAEMANWIKNNFAHAGIPCGFITGCPSRTGMWAGWAPLDGQELERAMFPRMAAMLDAGLLPTTDEDTWWADPYQRGKFVANSSPGKFRLADRNGIQEGSLGALFQRGDGHLSAGEAGLIQMDAFQGHHHSADVTGNGASRRDNNASGGERAHAQTAGLNVTVGDAISDGVNGDPRMASETRPLNVTDCWAIRLYGATVNQGEVDVMEIANDHIKLLGRIIELENSQGFTYVYPNGGTAEAPALITKNTRYVEDNPFPNRQIHCQVEVFHKGIWADPGWYSTSATSGTGAVVGEVEGEIVLQTGYSYLVYTAAASGNLGGWGTDSGTVSLPARIKVWKLAGEAL